MNITIKIKNFVIRLFQFIVDFFTKKNQVNQKPNPALVSKSRIEINHSKHDKVTEQLLVKKTKLINTQFKNNLPLYQARYEPYLLINGIRCVSTAHPLPIVKHWEATQKSIQIIDRDLIKIKP